MTSLATRRSARGFTLVNWWCHHRVDGRRRFMAMFIATPIEAYFASRGVLSFLTQQICWYVTSRRCAPSVAHSVRVTTTGTVLAWKCGGC